MRGAEGRLTTPALIPRALTQRSLSTDTGDVTQDYAPAIVGQKTYGGLNAGVYNLALDTAQQDHADMSI